MNIMHFTTANSFFVGNLDRFEIVNRHELVVPIGFRNVYPHDAMKSLEDCVVGFELPSDIDLLDFSVANFGVSFKISSSVECPFTLKALESIRICHKVVDEREMVLVEIQVHWSIVQARQIHHICTSIFFQFINVDSDLILDFNGGYKIQGYTLIKVHICVFFEFLFQPLGRSLQSSDNPTLMEGETAKETFTVLVSLTSLLISS